MKTNKQLADDLDCVASEVMLSTSRWTALADAATRLRELPEPRPIVERPVFLPPASTP